MLHAPTNDRKNKAQTSSKPTENLSQQEQPSHLLRSRRSDLMQQRKNLAAMQNAYGNQALLRMGRSSTLHPMQGGILQRKCACGNAASAAGTCAECQQKQKLSQQSQTAGTEIGIEVPPIVQEVLNSPGQPLDLKTRTFTESRFGHDFSRVRVHSGAAAEQSARAVNALAYTAGRDIVFGVGQYEPHTSTGQHLLAHELAHVVQQDGNVRDLQQDSKLGEENDRYEQEAEKSAAQCMSGAQVQVPSRISSTLIQRTKVCSKRLEAPGLGRVFNHSYIDDTGMDNCLGSSMLGNYAVQTLVSGNFVKGCAVKTATSTDPIGRTPNVKQCDPKPGVTDLSRCLLDTYNSYADPSVYKNPFGPNSNTFAATLAKNCCADGSSSGLDRVPGWDAAPALPCPQQQQRLAAAGEEESPQEETAT